MTNTKTANSISIINHVKYPLPILQNFPTHLIHVSEKWNLGKEWFGTLSSIIFSLLFYWDCLSSGDRHRFLPQRSHISLPYLF